MLRYSWRTDLSDTERGEVEELARRAAAEDAEAGFSGVGLDAVPGARHLLVRMLPRETGESLGLGTEIVDDELPLVAHLRVTVGGADAVGEIRYVVDPERRSLGVSTQLFEMLGLDVDAPGGWAGTGARSLSVWAHGNHPATRRMARRRRARTTRRLFRMTRPFHGEFAEILPEEVPLPGVTFRVMEPERDAAGVAALLDGARLTDIAGRWTVADVGAYEEAGEADPGDVVVAVSSGAASADAGEVLAMVAIEPSSTPTGPLTTGRLRCYAGGDGVSSETGAALVLRALHVLRDRGFLCATAYVDSEHDELVKVLMAATVEHEHSDVAYAIP